MPLNGGSVARAVRMMCIVNLLRTSAEDSPEPAGNEQRCQLQSMNYIALTTRVNCSRLLNHNLYMYTV